MKRFVIALPVLFGLTACAMPEPEPPVVDYKSKHRITFLYDPLDYYTSAPPEMLDMAEDYCNSLGKTSIETGTRYTSSWTGQRNTGILSVFNHIEQVAEQLVLNHPAPLI